MTSITPSRWRLRQGPQAHHALAEAAIFGHPAFGSARSAPRHHDAMLLLLAASPGLPHKQQHAALLPGNATDLKLEHGKAGRSTALVSPLPAKAGRAQSRSPQTPSAPGMDRSPTTTTTSSSILPCEWLTSAALMSRRTNATSTSKGARGYGTIPAANRSTAMPGQTPGSSRSSTQLAA